MPEQYIGYVTTVISIIIGIVVSYYFYLKSKVTKEPMCYYKNFQDIIKYSPESGENIKVFYKGQEIERVFTTFIWLWNAGRLPITKEDLRSNSNLIIDLQDEEYPPTILDFRIVKISNKDIHSKVARVEHDNSLSLQFDFLDYKDGVAIEIKHTGGFKTKPIIEGKILGVAEGFKYIQSETSSEFKERKDARAFPFSTWSKYTRKSITPFIGSLIFMPLLIYILFPKEDTVTYKLGIGFVVINFLWYIYLGYKEVVRPFPFPRALEVTREDDYKGKSE